MQLHSLDAVCSVNLGSQGRKLLLIAVKLIAIKPSMQQGSKMKLQYVLHKIQQCIAAQGGGQNT